MNTLQFLEAEYPVAQEDAYLLKTNYVFDVSISELFGWFIGNGRLVICRLVQKKSAALHGIYPNPPGHASEFCARRV